MAEMQGMVVRLKTKDEKRAGTDDHIYVGVVGTGGGSEFPLDVPGFNDFKKGHDITYAFGSPWDPDALSGVVKEPYENLGWNHPTKREISLYDIQYVYIRKHSHSGDRDDDKWKMDEVEVILYGPGPYDGAPGHKRTFRKTGDIWLANEFGLKVWLIEERREASSNQN